MTGSLGEEVGVELYLVRPNSVGELPADLSDIFPEEDGEGCLWDGDVHSIDSLKWATRWQEGRRTLLDFHLFDSRPIPPEELRSRSLAALRSLLAEIGELDPHYRWMVEDAGVDAEKLVAWLSAFECEEDWVYGEDRARERAFEIAREWSGLPDLIWRIMRAGEAGYRGYWSY